MFKRLTQYYEFTCDRCGKKETCSESERSQMGLRPVEFRVVLENRDKVTKGDVCDECYKEFCEIAENFFDEVNKENEGKPKKKPKAEYVGYNSHDCEAFYRCPVCYKTFGTWTIYGKKETRCPHCNEELEDIK